MTSLSIHRDDDGWFVADGYVADGVGPKGSDPLRTKRESQIGDSHATASDALVAYRCAIARMRSEDIPQVDADIARRKEASP